MHDPDELTPERIVSELDKHIVGQQRAKRAVAIALRNRWRRLQVVDEELQDEITPKNILMMGPTGVGKTEISRRLARLADAPFIKVEATKFTEVGYVGREVDSIIRDLVDIAADQCRSDRADGVREAAESAARERVLDALKVPSDERERFKLALKAGEYDEEAEIEIEVSNPGALSFSDFSGMPGMEEMATRLQDALQSSPLGGSGKKKRKMKIGDALELLTEEEIDSRLDESEIREDALERVESSGIVFIDEIDKIASGSHENANVDISRQGVQRDLLPLIEGTSVSTRFGMVNTSHILFIASGSFHYTTPKDLIPELQGRLPIRVELSPLDLQDFVKILNETEHCLMRQYEALFKTEGLDLTFKPEAVQRLAEIAQRRNEVEENIGARRLHTLMENLLEDIAFRASQLRGQAVAFDAAMVDDALKTINGSDSASRFII